MISLKELEICDVNSYNNLHDILTDDYLDDVVITKLKKYLGERCKKIVVEYPYCEKDYLSTYYIHYSKKFHKFRKDCCRLHILAENNEYCGYIVLRPTVKGTKLGTSYIDPHIIIKEDAYLMLSNYKVHILGQEFSCRSFPWMMQETDISVCAHVSLWTVLRYYGNKYKNYTECAMGDIIEKIQGDWGRKTPSGGLTPLQIADVLKLFNFSPIVRGGEKRKSDMFLDEMISYIESGIPMIAFISSKQHAISIMGHGKVNYEKLDDPDIVEQMKDKENNIILHSKLISSLYVMEDNCFPYRKITKELPTSESDVDYYMQEIAYAVIPLYPRMQLVYNEVYERYVALVEAKVMNWEEIKISRIYITSSNSLKRVIAETSGIAKGLKDIILTLRMPKFIWCIDIAGVENYKNGLTSGKIIIDTTCPTQETEPWLLMHDSERIRYLDENEIKEKHCKVKPYKIYTNNLVHIKC